jgi:hypothetical protein
MISPSRLILFISLLCAAASAFAPTTSRRLNNITANQLNLFGRGGGAKPQEQIIESKVLKGNVKGAKSHEEDIERTIELIMKYAAKVDTDNIIDDDDDQRVVGNAATETNVVQEVKSGEDPMQKIKSFGKKIKGKFQKTK